MLEWLYRALGAMLNWLSIDNYYALGLLFYALIFKVVFLPFAIKQQKNQIKMAKLAPKIELIKAKYKGRTDQPTMQKQQQEIMELQQKEGASPMSGCLPLIIQLPLIMLLYTVIRGPMSYIAKTTPVIDEYNDYVAGETVDINHIKEEWPDLYRIYGWKIATKNDKGDTVATKATIERADIVGAIKWHLKTDGEDATALTKIDEITLVDRINDYVYDDEGKVIETNLIRLEEYGIDYETIPSFNLFGISLAKKPWGNWSVLMVIPFLAAAAQWLSMFLTKKLNKTGLEGPQDAQAKTSMKMMDLVMPLMTVVMAFMLPAMLGLYWVYQSLLGLLQSFLLAKAMPLPKYTEEDVKALRRQAKEVEKANREAMKSQPKYKSLHYIDDEDYEELPDAKPETKAESKKAPKNDDEAPEIKD